jgi:hypothetical protein
MIPALEDTMSAPTAPGSAQLHAALRQELLRLARLEEDCAAREAERAHYWEPTPETVVIHRRCAAALRTAADGLLTTSSPVAPATERAAGPRPS